MRYNNQAYNLLAEIVEGIIECADELKASNDKSEYNQGQLLAYAESLSIIRDAFAGRDLGAIGLDFDIDKKYLE